MIVQDDAVLCDGFVELATAAAEDCACRVVCLFVSFQARQAVSEMNWVASEGGGFAKIGNDHFIPAVANAWPGWAARQVVEWADANARSLGKGIADDGVLATACRALEIEVWATVPSLVQHLDEVPSLMSERVGQKYRRAALPHPSLPV